MDLRLDQIQGNVIPGFRTTLQAVVALRFDAPDRARAWLGLLAPSITSGQEVAKGRIEAPGAWLNVALSWIGLEALDAPGREALADEFKAGMFARAGLLGDGPTDGWTVGGSSATEASALLIIAANDQKSLADALGEQRKGWTAHGIRELATFQGERLPGNREHFGYHDGISQPVIAGYDAPTGGVRAGEFVLGYPDQALRPDRPGPDWAQDGSYLVFRRLRQDVAGFRQTMESEGAKVGLSGEQLGAKVVGRWPSGAKLALPIQARDPDPQRADRPAMEIRRLDFAEVPEGHAVPLFAHVRKANPRDVNAAQPSRHRLLRRGIPYGVPLTSATDDKQDRGLLFLAYQASIANQFEHIQRAWFNDPGFPPHGNAPAPGADPLVGQPAGARAVSLPDGDHPAMLQMARFVSVTGGGYFFAPSLRALAGLARPLTAFTLKKETDVATDVQGMLGQFIFNENPYPWAMNLPNLATQNPQGVERDGIGQNFNAVQPYGTTDVYPDKAKVMQGLFWYFDGNPHRVSKAVRVAYTYVVNGEQFTDYLLIGYEGAGGGQ